MGYYELRKHRSEKSQNFIELLSSTPSSFWNENCVSNNKNLMKKKKLHFFGTALFHINTRVCFRYFNIGCLWKQFLTSNVPHTLWNLICLSIFVTLRVLTQFSLKLKSVICKKVLELILLDNYFPDLFTGVQIWSWNPFKFDGEHYFIKIQWTPANICLLSTIKAANKDIKCKRNFRRQSCS